MSTAILAFARRSNSATAGHRRQWELTYNVAGLSGAGDNPLAADGLPNLDDYTSSPGWVSNAMEARLDPDLESFATVTVTWIQDPVYLPLEISFYTSHKNQAAWTQADPVAKTPGVTLPDDGTHHIVNAAGTLFNPPLTYDKPLIRMEIVRRYLNANFSPNIITQYCFHKNSHEFRLTYTDGNNVWQDLGTFPIGSMYLADIRAPEVFEPYYHKQVTWCFEIDYDLWIKKVPNMGPLVRLPGKNGLFLPVDARGHRLNGQAVLGQTGYQEQPDPSTGALSVIDLCFNVVGAVDFNKLYLLTAALSPSGRPTWS